MLINLSDLEVHISYCTHFNIHYRVKWTY